MRNYVVAGMLVLLALFIGCTEGFVRMDYDFEKAKKVAVINVTGNLDGEAARNQVADFFVMELLKKEYSPVARAGVQKILREQKFQASQNTPEEDAARAGKMLNVPAVIMVNVSNRDDEINISAKMIDVETAEILWISSGTGKANPFWSTLLGVGAGAAAGSAVAGKHNQAEGVIVGGLIGGWAGREIAPKTAKRFRKIVKQMCKTLPYTY